LQASLHQSVEQEEGEQWEEGGNPQFYRQQQYERKQAAKKSGQ